MIQGCCAAKKIIVIFLNFLFAFPVFASPDIHYVVGQMMMVGFAGTIINEHSPVVQAIKNNHIGGVILFDHFDQKKNGHWVTRNIQNPVQLKALINQLQFYAKKYDDYPLFIAVNQEGGQINALQRNKGFHLGDNWSQAQLGAKPNKKIIYQQALYRGKLLRDFGINLNLAPVADLTIGLKNPAVNLLSRSFGRDPLKVTKELANTIKAYQQAHIACALKHFPGLGSAKDNTDYRIVNVSASWQASELVPYQRLIKKNKACEIIMTTHAINSQLDASGLPMTFSKPVITELLRNRLHYQGIIMTDDMDAKAITTYFSKEQAIQMAVNAGNDIILYGGTLGQNPVNDTKILYATLLKLAYQNKEARQKMMTSFARIQKLKERKRF